MALLHVDFFSEVLGMCMEMDIILPQRTKGLIGMESQQISEHYKTLYLLHGLSDDHTIWQRRTSIERYASELGIAVVMPTTHRAFYTDTTYGMKYWSFISQELPEICREFFPKMSDKREDNLVAGLSMGGYGAWKVALGTEGAFGAAASLSGALDIVELYKMRSEESALRRKEFEGIFGTLEQLEGSENDILALLQKNVDQKKELPRLYAWCGTSDDLYPINKKVWKHTEELGYDLTWEESEGDHQWKYWDEKIQDVLHWWLDREQDGRKESKNT